MRDIYSEFTPSINVPPPPATFEEAVDLVASWGVDINAPGYHMFEGMSLRNSLDLWNKNGVLHKHMVERFGLCHADDTGTLISEAADAKKKGVVYNPIAYVNRCKEHWKRYGLDPGTMEKV